MKAPATREASPLLRHGLAVALVGVAAIWGATFVTVKESVERVPVFEFLALRYGLAGVVLTAVFFRQAAGLGRAGLRAGVLAGVALFAGYTFQTIGLQYTRASNAGFVTGLFVVIAPVLAAIVLRRRPSAGPIAGVVLATAGLFLLSLSHGFHIRYGDAIVLLAALSFAVHIVVLARYSPEHSPAGLTVVQMWVAGVLSAVCALAFEHPVAPTSGVVIRGVIVTGLFASALAFFIQTLAQRYVSPTRTAVILVTEPAFAGLFGIVFLSESLTVRGWIGAGLILAGMLVAELAPRRTAEG